MNLIVIDWLSTFVMDQLNDSGSSASPFKSSIFTETLSFRLLLMLGERVHKVL